MRLLIVTGQSAFDLGSGAAQSMRGIAELVASVGTNTQFLCTSAIEADNACTNSQLPIDVTTFQHGELASFTHRKVVYSVVVDKKTSGAAWERSLADSFQRAFDNIIATDKPTVCLSFATSPKEIARLQTLKDAGIPVVFALHTMAYLQPTIPAYLRDFIKQADAIIAPSQFVKDAYQKHQYDNIQVIPPPILSENTVIEQPEPIFTTFVNPSPAKGLMFIVSLFKRICDKRPDIPLFVQEGRGNLAHFFEACKLCGLDVNNAQNIFVGKGYAPITEVLANTRVLLMPSVVDEAAGRLPLEAMTNAIPVISSARGGLPEMVGGAGKIIALHNNLNPETRKPVPSSQVKQWFSEIVKLYDNDAYYSKRTQDSAAEMRSRSRHTNADAYVTLFKKLGA